MCAFLFKVGLTMMMLSQESHQQLGLQQNFKTLDKWQQLPDET